jgi:predicted ester cyclase
VIEWIPADCESSPHGNTAAAQAFMSAFPDMVVTMDDLSVQGNHAIYRWTLSGTNTGPGGTGRAVRISGYEEWTLGEDGLIAESKGHFDQADYQRQLAVRGERATGEGQSGNGVGSHFPQRISRRK